MDKLSTGKSAGLATPPLQAGRFEHVCWPGCPLVDVQAWQVISVINIGYGILSRSPHIDGLPGCEGRMGPQGLS